MSWKVDDEVVFTQTEMTDDKTFFFICFFCFRIQGVEKKVWKLSCIYLKRNKQKKLIFFKIRRMLLKY